MGTWEGGKVGTEDAPLGHRRSNATKRVVSRFEDLEVWQTARELTRGVFKACRTQRLADEKPLASQMKRAAVSIGSNIAEGYERGTRKQQIEHCLYAKGSAGELRSQVITAHDVGLLNDEARKWLLDMCERVSRQLAMYIAHLKRTQKTIPGVKMAKERRGGSVVCPPSHLPTFPPSHVIPR